MSHTSDSARNSSSALEQLRQLIQQQEQQPDRALPTERELAERFGVGRREIRRALDVLEEEGRIWRKQGKGTFVGPAAPVQPLALHDLPQQSNLLEVMEARLQLEPGLARLAALRASKEQIALMKRLLERMNGITAPEDGDQHELWDSAFHRAIAEAAGNRLMLGLFDAVDAVRRDPGWQHLRVQARTPARLNNYDDHHQRLVNHIAQRQPHEAAAAMREHLLALQQALLEALYRHQEETP
ncbi:MULTISPECIES: FadR/GntR family transcriptional regulator [unclassified Pantoea]|uniref:FadR/GntR family transcriptional regulator n=1 Tax=unclassified Pantoea TaxID=2630326 RepID=UPI001CD29362|nr:MULTISPECIES: FCD domain-containing protein [unclassified Pantoea]MCA1178506.1 FCD domain-containing protein [Pantoea sp. alder69]MCA1250928.1 FCD domain-containing protein [Pantoea sp. alder70]MCA1266956.1 FCD domain-containing protein [Pantoea sp. alder81]